MILSKIFCLFLSSSLLGVGATVSEPDIKDKHWLSMYIKDYGNISDRYWNALEVRLILQVVLEQNYQDLLNAALIVAADNDHYQLAYVLIENGAQWEFNFYKAIRVALANNNIKIIELFLGPIASRDVINQLINFAINEKTNDEIFTLLLSYIDADDQDILPRILRSAAIKNRLSMVRLILSLSKQLIGRRLTASDIEALLAYLHEDRETEEATRFKISAIIDEQILLELGKYLEALRKQGL